MRRRAALAALVVVACASAPAREGGPPPADRTDDPRFEAARDSARPEFETQADALAAGVYEPFVHPDSVRPAAREGAVIPVPGVAGEPGGPAPRGAGDPTTAELLGTLEGGDPYNPPAPVPSEREVVERPVAEPSVVWTLQLGAFTTEAGALVRIRQIERDLPEWPRWYAAGDGWVRVYAGRFPDRASAEQARRTAADRGYRDAWVTRAP